MNMRMLISAPLPPKKKKRSLISACISAFDVFSVQTGKGEKKQESEFKPSVYISMYCTLFSSMALSLKKVNVVVKPMELRDIAVFLLFGDHLNASDV